METKAKTVEENEQGNLFQNLQNLQILLNKESSLKELCKQK